MEEKIPLEELLIMTLKMLKVSKNTTTGIILILKNEQQQHQMIQWLFKNKEANEQQIIKKAKEIMQQ